jgi:type VI secretion system protein ImpL
LATNPALAPQVNATLPAQIQTLRNAANLMPPPFSGHIQTAAKQFEEEQTGTTVSQLLVDLRSQVLGACTPVVTNRYPFTKSAERDVPIADFGRLFGPGGVIDRFFAQNLASLVDTAQPNWTLRQTSGVARSLPPDTIRQFQRAAEIREAFFASGGTMPSFTMAITPLLAPGETTSIKLDVNGVAVQPQAGNAPTSVVWPGPAGLERTILSMAGSSGFFGGSSAPVMGPERRGPWSFFRFLDAGSVSKRGDSVLATFAMQGQSITYQINISALRNPLTLTALREFRCPGG